MIFALGAKHTPIVRSKLTSHLPVVCILALEGTKDFKELSKEFMNHINKLEPQVYERNHANHGNLNEKVHRLQFGKINLNRNPKFRNDIINKINKPNPRYFVYISEAGLVGVFNNIQDLEYVIDDALHGEFVELTPLKDILEHDYEIHELLTNETLSFIRVVLYHLTSSLFYRIFMFAITFLVFTKMLNVNTKKALIISGCLVGSMVFYGIVEKLLIENIV